MYGVGKIGDIFAGCDIDESHPTKSNIEGIQQTEQLLREIDEGFVFVNLVETDMLWGHRNDPVNFHRCLQDFDYRLPDLLDALRPGDLLVITSDHGCDPTTPSTDHSREYALLLAYVEGRNAAGQIHEGEFADVGATVNAWLGGKAPSRGIPGQPDRRAVGPRRRRPTTPMPELPEVESVRRQLEPALVGRRFERVSIDDPRLVRPYEPAEVAAELKASASPPSSGAASIWLFGSRAVVFS